MSHAPRSRVRRRGYALIAVLWVMVGVAALGVELSFTSRSAITAAQNRVDLLRAQWRAESCVESARSVIDEALGVERTGLAPATVSAWQRLDAIIAESPLMTGCDLSMRPSGTTIDVNTESIALVRAALVSDGIVHERADSLADALADWRDGDDVARSRGAERAWYAQHHRPLPANAPIASIEELARVRGFETLSGLDTLLGTEADRIWLARAPRAVLRALPGLGDEAAVRILELRRGGTRTFDLSTLAALLSPASRAALLAHFAELTQRTTASPDAWTIVSRAAAGPRYLTASLEVRVVNAGARAAIVRRTCWP